MPPFRLLQVASLDLDAVLARPPFELADLCENAPLYAAGRIVEAAIEHDVDGVLISPVAPRDGLPEVLGLAAVESLHDLIESLREQEISVVLAASSNVPFWRRLLGRDARTRLLTPGERIPFHDRHGRLCAELHCLDSVEARDTLPQKPSFSLGVAPTLSVAEVGSSLARGYDFFVLGAGPRETRRIDRCVAHCPGAPQATSAASVGPHGVTLVTVDGVGIVETEFISTASVRFEAFSVSAEAGADLDEVALRMMEHLEGRGVEASEQGWIVAWTLRVAGDLLERLETRRGRSELLALLPDTHEGRLVNHRLTVVPMPNDVIDVPFATEFRAALQERRGSLASTAGRTALVGLNSEGRHHRRIVELLAAANVQDVVDQAHRIGLRLSTAVQNET